MSAAKGQEKRPDQKHNPGVTPNNKKRTTHLLQNRTDLLALNSGETKTQ
jgi:hypothetical protein